MSTIPSRFRAQITAFVQQARDTGLEKDWIALISGKQVQPDRLSLLDDLIGTVISGVQKEAVQTRTLKPWAQLRQDSFTNRNVLEFEIPKTARVGIQKEALAQANGNEGQAKTIYTQKLAQLRNETIRNYAAAQTMPTVPPLRVRVLSDEEREQKAEKVYHGIVNHEVLAELRKTPLLCEIIDNTSQYPHFNTTQGFVKSSETQSVQELMEQLKSVKDDIGGSAYALRVFLLEQIVQIQNAQKTKQTQEKEKEKRYQSAPRSLLDPDWSILESHPETAQAAKVLRPYSRALRKLFLPIAPPQEDAVAANPAASVIKATADKLLEIDEQNLEQDRADLINLIRDFRRAQDEAHELIMYQPVTDISQKYPEVNADFERQMLNSNFLDIVKDKREPF